MHLANESPLSALFTVEPGQPSLRIYTNSWDAGFGFRVAMRPGKRRALPDTPEGRVDDLIETAKAHVRAKVKIRSL